MRISAALFLTSLCLLAAPAPATAHAYSGPIIDVHMHVGAAAPRAPNPATGQPTTADTDADRERLTLERMRQHGIVLGLVSGPDAAMASMRKAGGEDMIWAGAFLDDGRTPLPPAEVLREAFANGDLKVMGEIGAQYHGLDPSDEWFEPYLTLAEEFDIPVGIHTGLAPPARRTAAVPISACRSAIPCGSSPCSSATRSCGSGWRTPAGRTWRRPRRSSTCTRRCTPTSR